MKKIFILCFIGYTVNAFAQDNCAQQPAPCPHSSEITFAMDVVSRTKNSISFPQELAMENKLRNAVTDEVQRIAKEKNWSVYEVNEKGNYGPPYIYIDYKDWEATPFNKRPPSHYDISFIVIINQDSLNAWKNWLLNEVQSQSEQLGNQYRQSQNNPLLKQYSDSFDYYNGLQGKQIETDGPAYMKALQNKDQKGIDAYQNKRKALMDKVTFFTKKIQAIQNENAKPTADALEEWANKTISYSESSMVLVHFAINPYLSNTGFHSPEVDENSVPEKNISVAGAYHATIITNPVAHQKNDYTIHDYDLTFPAPSCTGWVLFGDYLPKKEDNNYPAAFTKNFHDKASVLDNVKAVSCDKVQNIEVHVQGGKRGVDELIKGINWEIIKKLLYKP